MKIPQVAKILAGLLVANGAALAADIVRSSSSGPVNLTTAWVGGVVPGSGDTAVWKSGANTGTTTLGADLSWYGIRVEDPTAVSTGGTNTLTLGAGGIDMTSATVDATFNFDYSLGASQTWAVASGRTLNLNNAAIAGGGSAVLTLSGPGSVYMTSATDQTYSGGTVLQNGVTVYIGNNNGGGNFGTGKVSVQGSGVTIAAHAAGIRTLNTQLEFLGSANTLTLGTTSLPSQFIASGGVSFGTAQRTISLVNTNTASTSNIALTLGGVASGGSGGSLVLSNGNPTPASQEVWVKLGNSASEELDFDGSLVIGENVQAYFRSSNNLGDGTDLTVNGILDVSSKTTGAVTPTIKSLSGSGLIYSGRTSTGTNTLTIDGGASTGTTTFSGNLENGATSPLALTKAGSSTQILTGTNTYSGATAIEGGVLQAAGASLSSNSIVQLRGGVLQSSGTFSRNVTTGAGGVNWATSSGGFAAVGSTLTLQLNGGTGSLTWNASSFVQTGQTLIFGSTSADSLVDFQNGLNLGTSGTNTRTISVIDNTGSSTDSARISGAVTGNSNQTLQKEGDGLLELSNASNTYSGATIVNAGTLLVTGGIASTGTITVNGGKFSSGVGVTIANEVVVNSGGRLGGNGTYSDSTGITFGSGAIASPGNSAGNTIYATDMTLDSGAIYEWELGAYGTTAGTDSDLLTITGSGNVMTFASGSLLTLNFIDGVVNPNSAGTGGFWLSDHQWMIADATSSGSISDLGLAIQGTSSFANGSFSIAGSGGDLYLNYTAVPEPSTVVLAGLGLSVAIFGFRRRLKA